MGVFGSHSADYLAHDIAVFPTGGDNGKRALVRNYQKMGLPASRKLSRNPKFEDANIGFLCGQRNGITVVDVDTPDRTVFERVLTECGDTPVKIQTASDKFQAWYRWNGERRRIRPIDGEEIDILGGGVCVAPPSVRPGMSAPYRFIEGGLDDVDHLPAIKPGSLPIDAATAPPGSRNNALFCLCLRDLKDGHDPDLMMARALVWNEGLPEPLPEAEVERTVASAIRYHIEGRNWIGSAGVLKLTRANFESFAGDADAYLLFSALLFAHGARKEPFCIVSRAMAAESVIPGWGHNRYEAAARRLVTMGKLTVVERGGGRGKPNLYVFADKLPSGRAEYK